MSTTLSPTSFVVLAYPSLNAAEMGIVVFGPFESFNEACDFAEVQLGDKEWSVREVLEPTAVSTFKEFLA